MSNYEQIGKLYDKAEKLVGVRYAVFDAGSDGKDWIEAVEMRFESAAVTVYVESDFDTLRLELSDMKIDPDCSVKVATSIEPWDKAVGKSLSWIWLLTNQQGYEDGLRFEFSAKETPAIITLIGLASSIQIYISQKFEL